MYRKEQAINIPGATVDEGLPASTGGFNPWSGKTPNAMEQLSPCASTTEPVARAQGLQLWKPKHPEPVLCNERNDHEKPTLPQRGAPLAAT